MNPHQFDRASVVVVGLTLAGVLALVIYAIYLTIFGSVT